LDGYSAGVSGARRGEIVSGLPEVGKDACDAVLVGLDEFEWFSAESGVVRGEEGDCGGVMLEDGEEEAIDFFAVGRREVIWHEELELING
jgi:hypothetical protein